MSGVVRGVRSHDRWSWAGEQAKHRRRFSDETLTAISSHNRNIVAHVTRRFFAPAGDRSCGCRVHGDETRPTFWRDRRLVRSRHGTHGSTPQRMGAPLCDAARQRRRAASEWFTRCVHRRLPARSPRRARRRRSPVRSLNWRAGSTTPRSQRRQIGPDGRMPEARDPASGPRRRPAPRRRGRVRCRSRRTGPCGRAGTGAATDATA